VSHAAISAVALVAASAALSVSALASSVVLASGIVALPEEVPAVAVVPLAAPALEPVVVVPVLAPVATVLPEVAPVVAVPEDAGVLLLPQAAANNPAVTPNPNTFMNFIFSPAMSKENPEKMCGHTTLLQAQ
jgi:hypothetical protein